MAFDTVCLDASSKNEFMQSTKWFSGREYEFCLGFLLVWIYTDCAYRFSCPKMTQVFEMASLLGQDRLWGGAADREVMNSKSSEQQL